MQLSTTSQPKALTKRNQQCMRTTFDDTSIQPLELLHPGQGYCTLYLQYEGYQGYTRSASNTVSMIHANMLMVRVYLLV